MASATDTAEMNARHARMLGRLAELGMMLAEDLAARAHAAGDAQEAALLSSGFHRLSRSVRQSLALEARLHRDNNRLHAEAEQRADAEVSKAPAARKAEVRARLDRLVWTEAGDEHTAKFWTDGVVCLIAEAEATGAFETQAPDQIFDAMAETLRASVVPGDAPGAKTITEFCWTITDPKIDGGRVMPVEEHFARDDVRASTARNRSSPGADMTHRAAAGTEAVEVHSGRHTGRLPATLVLNTISRPAPAEETLRAAPTGIPQGLPGEFGPNGETGEDRPLPWPG